MLGCSSSLDLILKKAKYAWHQNFKYIKVAAQHIERN